MKKIRVFFIHGQAQNFRATDYKYLEFNNVSFLKIINDNKVTAFINAEKILYFEVIEDDE